MARKVQQTYLGGGPERGDKKVQSPLLEDGLEERIEGLGAKGTWQS